MERISSIFLCTLLALSMIAAVSPQARAQKVKQSELKNPDVVLHVKGMACRMCARSMTNALEKLDAVDEVQVLLEEDQKVLLALKEGATVSEEALREAVTNAGFSFISAEFRPEEQSNGAHSSERSSDAAAAQVIGGVQVIHITASDMGYEPEQIQLQEGVPARLVFKRTTKSHCMEQVQIPAFGIEKVDLPLNEPVTIEFTPNDSGAFTFACGMDMLEGTIVVKS